MSELLAIGVSHKTAPVEIRERLALTDERAGTLLRDLRGTGEIREVVHRAVRVEDDRGEDEARPRRRKGSYEVRRVAERSAGT